MIRYRGELSTDDISYFKLMFGMGSFPDAYGESCVSIVQFDFQGSGITQVCMGGFIERPSKTYSGLIEIIVPLKVDFVSMTEKPPISLDI